MNNFQQSLALAAGGSLGAYQSGVLLYLAENGIKFNQLSGASIGALNGAFYAQGDGSISHMQDLCSLWFSLSNANILQINGSNVARIASMFFSRELPMLSQLINRFSGNAITILDPTPIEQFLDKWIDYDAVCTSQTELIIAVLQEIEPLYDIISSPWRSATYFTSYELTPINLRRSLLAASAIPLVFPSQNVENQRYSDAGLVDPLPALELYRRGARRIISIFLSDDTVQNRGDFVNATILQIRPSTTINLGLSSIFDFSHNSIDRLINLGYNDAKNICSEITDLLAEIVELRKMGEKNMLLTEKLPNRRQRRK